MLARLWHGRTTASDAEEYFRFLERVAIPDYRGTPGNREALVLRRLDGGVAHFLLITLWESQDAIEAFAGPAIERARYYPEDTGFLLEMEPTVNHYELRFSSGEAGEG